MPPPHPPQMQLHMCPFWLGRGRRETRKSTFPFGEQALKVLPGVERQPKYPAQAEVGNYFTVSLFQMLLKSK